MRMSINSYNSMNSLATLCFEANAIIDNLAYSLDYHFYNEIGNIVHHNVAHVMPMWADIVTDQMLVLGGRPVREALNGYAQDYDNLEDIFNTLHSVFLSLRDNVRGMIENADMDGDDEVRIFGEDFLQNHLSKFIKQSEEWINASKNMDANRLNVHIKEYTHFINL